MYQTVEKMTPEALLFNIQRQKYWFKSYKLENSPAGMRQALDILRVLKKAYMGKGAM